MHQIREAQDPVIPILPCEVATHQIERAIQLFLEQEDYICAITLAGAGEEILGKLLQRQGKIPSLKKIAELSLAISKSIAPINAVNEKLFIDYANQPRNRLKHFQDIAYLETTRLEAIHMLDRAIENYCSMSGSQTEIMTRYMTETHKPR